ncbi:hypothetical protein C8Q74DRAFT_1452087 [Fomes fomentarius]|nr:hypothetical protein C8Q74DRAFT_1452087 [Fomes fomentarius]
MTPSNLDTPAYSDGAGWGSEWDKKGGSGTPPDLGASKEGGLVAKAPNDVEEVPTSRSRRNWLYVVWLTTSWWIPSFALAKIGRMKRPDIQLAWREKVTIFWLIFLFNAVVIFYIVAFGRLLCPDFDKAWSINEVNQHTGDDDFWSNTEDTLSIVAGQDLTGYFPPPIYLACPGLVSDSSTLQLMSANFTAQAPQAMHKSGPTYGQSGSKLSQSDWYTNIFLKRIREFRKGPLVWDKNAIKAAANDADNQRMWAIYDLTDYNYTAGLDSEFHFLKDDIVSLFQQQPGQDITQSMNRILNTLEPQVRDQNLNCISNLFFIGKPDFRKSTRCQVQNILLVMLSIFMVSVAVKCGLHSQPAILHLSSHRTDSHHQSL